MWIHGFLPAFAPVESENSDRRFFLRFLKKALGTAFQSDDGAYPVAGTFLTRCMQGCMEQRWGQATMSNDVCEVAEMIEPARSTETGKAERSSLLQHYEAIAQASCVMLAAARAGDWIEVDRQEERCCALIAILKAAIDIPLSAADDERRMQLLRQILSDDAQIRGHAEPWLDPIAPYISTPRLGESDTEK